VEGRRGFLQVCVTTVTSSYQYYDAHCLLSEIRLKEATFGEVVLIQSSAFFYTDTFICLFFISKLVRTLKIEVGNGKERQVFSCELK
jgi:hypothetical protein